MDDKEAILILKSLLEKGMLSVEEVEAVKVAQGALSLMVHTSDGYLKQLKVKKEKQDNL